MTNFQIGAQLYSVRDHCQNYADMLETMKALKAMGYNTCQFSAHGKDITAQQLRDILDESGMTCASTHISFARSSQILCKPPKQCRIEALQWRF